MSRNSSGLTPNGGKCTIKKEIYMSRNSSGLTPNNAKSEAFR